MPTKCLAVMTVRDGPLMTPADVRYVRRYLQQLASDILANPAGLFDGKRWLASCPPIRVTFHKEARPRHADQLHAWLRLKADDLKKDRKSYDTRFTARYFAVST